MMNLPSPAKRAGRPATPEKTKTGRKAAKL